MPFIPEIQLLGGSYSSAGLLASAQRCINLFPEINPKVAEPPVSVTHRLAPGLFQLQTLAGGAGRGLYTSSQNQVFAAVGRNLYLLQNNGKSSVLLGQLGSGSGPVRMADNGFNMLVCDGTSQGYSVDLQTLAVVLLSAQNNSGLNGYGWTGANWVDELDSFLVYNMVGTSNWGSSNSNVMQFDPLSYAGKSGAADSVVGVVVLKRNCWIIGSFATELWDDTGGTPFPFTITPGPYAEAGLVGVDAMAKVQEEVVFLGQNKTGSFLAFHISDFRITEITNPCISQEWSSYPDFAQAVGFGYTFQGHRFFCFRFPVTDKTWVFDSTTAQWHERRSLNANGGLGCWKVGFATAQNGIVLGQDWQTGTIYQIDAKALDDAGTPITRLRSLPHLYDKMVRHTNAVLRIDCLLGAPLPDTAATLANAGNITKDSLYWRAGPLMQLNWSDDRGQSWVKGPARPLARQGNGQQLIEWRRLGQFRDRIFELVWTAPQLTALNGVFIDITGGRS